MFCNYQQLPHPGIQSLKPYIQGKSIEELAREEGLTDIIKLASNENPLGCSPLVKEALEKVANQQLATYPSPNNHPLLAKLSQKLGVSEQMLTFGNGSDLLFFFLLTTFALHTGKHMLTHDYAFITFAIQAQTLGIPVVSVPLKANWQVDIDAMIAACNPQTALIFLANPNNPTGLLIKQENIKRLLNSIPPTTLVVLDEAYYEYAYPYGDKTSINLLSQHANLVITRTFSKAYGLAGLRLGYAIANPEISELLQRVQLPFVVNQTALEAANAALNDEDFIKQTVECNIKGMQQLKVGLDSLAFNSLPSSANFITFDYQSDGLPLYQYLLKQGIIIRPLHPYNLNNHLRVSVGLPIHNARFLDKLASYLNHSNKGDVS